MLNEVRRQIFGDQFRVMSLEHFTEEIQDELFVRFQLLIFTLDESFGIVNAGDGCLRQKRRAGDQNCQE